MAAWRKELGLDHAGLNAKSGVSKSLISQVERGIRAPSRGEVVEALGGALGKDVAGLYFRGQLAKEEAKLRLPQEAWSAFWTKWFSAHRAPVYWTWEPSDVERNLAQFFAQFGHRYPAEATSRESQLQALVSLRPETLKALAQAKYSYLDRLLQLLIPIATIVAAVSEFGSDEERVAWTLCGDYYQHLSVMARRLGEFSFAIEAAERAATCGELAHNILLPTEAHIRLAEAYSSAGMFVRTGEAIAVATRLAAVVKVEDGGSRLMCDALLLQALAFAREGDQDDSRQACEGAAHAAGIADRVQSTVMSFSDRTTVAITTALVESMLNQPARALKLLKDTEDHIVSRHHRVLAHATRAHAYMRRGGREDAEKAGRELITASQLSPETLYYDRQARETAYDVLAKLRGGRLVAGVAADLAARIERAMNPPRKKSTK